MTENEKKDAMDCIKTQLSHDYVDIGGNAYENELEVVRQAINAFDKIPEIIDKLKRSVCYIEPDNHPAIRDGYVLNAEDVFDALKSLL